MGMNAGEIFLVVFLVIIIFGLGYLGDLGEAIGRMRRRALSPEAGAVDVTPPAKAARAEPPLTPERIAGPVEDAEVVDGEAKGGRDA